MKRRLGQRHTEGGHVRTQGENNLLKPKSKGSEETNPAHTLISDVYAPKV